MELTYYVSPWDQDAHDEPPDAPPALPGDPLWGYTLDDIDRLARVAVSRARTAGGDYRGRYEAAWSAVAEALCVARTQPNGADLIAAGWRAVADYARAEAHHHGIDRDTWGPLQGYDRYWAPRHIPSPETRVVQSIALGQIWPQLTERQQQALLVLATTEDYAQAADAMGIALSTFRVTVSTGRRRFLAWWHEGEPPSKVWRTDRRVYSRDGMWRGKTRITTGDLETIRARHYAGETLSAIGRDYGVGKGVLSSLLTGRTKPTREEKAA